MTEIRITNSESGKKETLKPQTPGKLTMYSCGPTVYNLIHMGNLRAAFVADLFFRYLQHAGLEVNYVRNYTDIDDKIIDRAKAEGLSAAEVAKKYIIEVEKDYALAGLKQPTKKTLATEHIPEMIAMIQRLVKKGHAYAVDGEVLFSVDSFPDYGKLSGRKPEDLLAGARVEVDQKKKNPLDFALWKPAKPGEPSWSSPWGEGRPGWHIECSAMSTKWLGNQIDLHLGGADLIFPHHENEIAQSEGATGEKPFVRYWVHNAFLTLDQEKMSKSLGNVFLARDFLRQYGGEVARMIFVSVHYRSVMDLSEETLKTALSGLQRIYLAKAQALQIKQKKTSLPDLRSENLWGSFVQSCEKAKREIEEHYANDLNTPGALGSLFTLIREFNRMQTEASAGTSGAHLGAHAFLDALEGPIGEVLGIGLSLPEKILPHIQAIRAARHGAGSVGSMTEGVAENEIQRLIQERNHARKNRDFSKADAIRDELAAKGIILKDSPQGTTWTYR